MLLQNFLEESARKCPGKTALVFGSEKLSYEKINGDANRLARLIRNCGVLRGERVAIFLDNSVETVVSIFGILKADAVFVILSPQLKPGKLSYILKNCGARVLISDINRIKKFSDMLGGIPSLRFTIAVGGADLDKNEETGPDINIIDWDRIYSAPPQWGEQPESRNINLDLASIIYTSGSTGDPKGVTLTHLNMVSAATSITTYLESASDDIVINVLPLSFDYGLYQVLMTFKMGATLVLEKSFSFPYEIVKRIAQEKVTGFPGVPTIFALLFQMKNLGKFEFGSLRYITNTAAALPVKHIRQLRETFPHVRIYSMYGLTECKRVSYLPPEDLDRKPDSVGKGMPNEEVWVVDESGEIAPPGTVGELVVRGSNVMKGYWADPAATDKVLKPGILPGEKVLFTGDLFRMDEEGYLYFVSRKDDLIKTRGERVSPKEIENVLYEMDGVDEAAVIPIKDDLLGDAIKAFIVLRNGHKITPKDLLYHCRKCLEEFAVPKYFEIRKSLPKNASGKIDKLVLRMEAYDQAMQ
jgi:amino acid adenylation domain-containing protein